MRSRSRRRRRILLLVSERWTPRRRLIMYAIMGITGRVGGAVAAALLAQGNRIRAIVRSPSKGSSWAERGAELAVADSLDTRALARAFRDVAGVFVMTPPEFAPSPGFPE